MTVDWAAGSISLDTTLTAGWQTEAVQTAITLSAIGTGLNDFHADLTLHLADGLSLGSQAWFDPQSASTRARFELGIPIQDATLSLISVHEAGAVGASLNLAATGDSVLRSLSIDFNLDRYGSLQTVSCKLPFSGAEARFAFPLDDCETIIDASIRFDCTGFSELTFTAPHVGGLPFGVSFAGFLTFTQNGKELQIIPSLSLENPNCFDFYTGLDWDQASHTLSTLRFYGLGLRCEVETLQFRALFALDPSALSLVKSPYKSLLGLVWPLEGCSGEPGEAGGEASLAFFFGDDNLFDLGEILGEVVLALTDQFTLSLLVEYPMTALPAFTLGWRYSFD